MNGMKWFWIALALYIVSIWTMTVLLISDIIGMTFFWILLAILTVALFIPLLKTGGTEAHIADNTLHIKAPMVSLSIPLSSITSIECRQEFKPGLRMFGYGGLKRGYGDFTNKEFSSYTYAGDSRILRFIVIGYGKNKVVVFNFKDAESTESLYRQISSGSDASPIVRTGVNSEKRYSRYVKLCIGITVGIILLVIAIIAIAFSAGHVDVGMDEDSITIDATMMKKDIEYNEIERIELRDDFDAGTRVGGYGTPKFSTGNFKNAEFGTYKLAMHNGIMPVVVIYCLNGDVVVFNTDDPDRTRTMAEELNERLGDRHVASTCSVPVACCI